MTQNITLPMVAGGYANDGAPYQLFSEDLVNGLVINGDHCRTTGTDCPVPNPPLAGSGAPAGYLNYYLRDNQTGAYHGPTHRLGDRLHGRRAGELRRRLRRRHA